MKIQFLKEQLAQFGRVSLMALVICGGKVAFAGERGGNGGDAIVCQDSVTLLDHFEMKRRSLTFDLGPSHLSIREKVMVSIQRLKRLEAVRADEIEANAKQMLKDIEGLEKDPTYKTGYLSVEDAVLTDIDDSYELALPEGCIKEQLVIQTKPIFAEDKIYLIRKKYWDRMDNDQKALTVLHESWYRNMLKYEIMDSRFVRYMNGLFASQDAEKLGLSGYLKKLFNAKNVSVFNKNIPPFLFQLNGSIISFEEPNYLSEGKIALSALGGQVIKLGKIGATVENVVMNDNVELLESNYYTPRISVRLSNVDIIQGDEVHIKRNELTGQINMDLFIYRYVFRKVMYSEKSGYSKRAFMTFDKNYNLISIEF